MLNPRRTYAYFRDTFLLKPSTQGWFAFQCPQCGKEQKAAVQFDWELVKCWVCTYKQSITEFVQDYEGMTREDTIRFLYQYKESEIDLRDFEAAAPIKAVDAHLPEHFLNIMDGVGVLGKRARTYLTDRGLHLKLCDKIGLGYVNKKAEEFQDDYFGYIIIPYKKDGKLYYWTARDYTGSNLRYKNPALSDFGVGKSELLFNEDALNSSIAFLTEGWACALTMGKGVALGGVDLSNKQRTKIINSPCETIVVVTDKGFYKQGLKIGMALLGHKEVKVVNLDNINKKDSTGKELKDPNELGAEFILDCYQKTKTLSFGLAISEMI